MFINCRICSCKGDHKTYWYLHLHGEGAGSKVLPNGGNLSHR